jgi:hypothetical protein
MTMRRFANTWVVFAWTLLAPTGHALAQGCAMCGNSFAPNDPVQQAMNTSVLFLLLMPYTMVAGVGCWLYFRYSQRGAPPRATVIALPWVRAGAELGRGSEEE